MVITIEMVKKGKKFGKKLKKFGKNWKNWKKMEKKWNLVLKVVKNEFKSCLFRGITAANV